MLRLAVYALRRGDDDAARTIVAEGAGGRRQPPARVDDDARRILPGNAPHRELRVVRDRRADADDDGINKRAQAMKMIKPIGAVDVMGMPGGGGCAPIERLPDLANDDELIDLACRERREDLVPSRQVSGTTGANGGECVAPAIIGMSRNCIGETHASLKIHAASCRDDISKPPRWSGPNEPGPW